MTVLTELQEAVAAVARSAGPSVVGIGGRLRGSGVVIADGRVLTNAHNLRGREVTVRFPDGRSTRGEVAAVDWDGDLAVVEVDTAGAPPVAWSGAGATIGSAVFAAAATPAGGPRVSFGFVSSVERAFRGPGGRRISGSLEHTAPLAPGSSGSPLLDADGALVGLNTNRVGEGFYLALPADDSLRGRVDALARGESRDRPRLGIAVAPAHVARRLRRSVGLPERDGVLVRGVEAGSPAEAAGIAEGDLLVAARGRAIDDVDALHEALRDAGFPFEVTLVRGTEERTVTVDAPAASADADREPGSGSDADAGEAPKGPVH
jgi:serine protease Do